MGQRFRVFLDLRGIKIEGKREVPGNRGGDTGPNGKEILGRGSARESGLHHYKGDALEREKNLYKGDD